MMLLVLPHLVVTAGLLAAVLGLRDRMRRVENRQRILVAFTLRILESHGGDPITEPEMARVLADLLATMNITPEEWQYLRAPRPTAVPAVPPDRPA